MEAIIKKQKGFFVFPKNKKGDHIGTVISFILFITFVVFLYSITSPSLKSDKSEENLLVYLENKIIENVSIDLNSMSVSFSSGSENCLQVSNYPSASNVIVQNSTGGVVNSEVSSGDLFIEISSEEFFKIYSSESIFNSPSWDSASCNSLSNPDVGLSRTEKKVSEEKILELINLYKLDYDGLKTYFNVPNSREFGLDFIYNNNTPVFTDTPNISENIYTTKVAIEYFDKEANVLQGFVNIKVW